MTASLRAVVLIGAAALAGCAPFRSGITNDLGTTVHFRIEGHGRCEHVEGDLRPATLHMTCLGDEIERIWVRRGTAPECTLDMEQARRFAAQTNAKYRAPANRFYVILSQVACT